MKTLVLGLGNELYGDDGVGIHVVRSIRETFAEGRNLSESLKDTDFVESSLSGLSLLDVIIGYDRLIIIDTIKKSDPDPGKIHILEEKDLRHIPGPSPHYVSIPQAIEIGKRIGLKVPVEIMIIAVEAKNMYNLGEVLSQAMKKAIPRIVSAVEKLLFED
jgi:hydrogenase maturation protease